MSSRGTKLTRPLTMVRGSGSPTSTCSTYNLQGEEGRRGVVGQVVRGGKGYACADHRVGQRLEKG
jgi:hypothetical protein